MPNPAPKPARHRRRGTAVLAKGQERVEAILDAATALLADEGHAQLSLRKIAAGAGMSLGNLQYYYRTKQDVVRALLERALAQSVANVEAHMRSAGADSAARLDAGVRAILADQESPATCRFYWELWALAARDPEVARATRGFYDRYVDEVAKVLRAAHGAIGPARARNRAALVVALFEGLTLFRLGAKTLVPLERGLAQEARALVVRLATEDA